MFYFSEKKRNEIVWSSGYYKAFNYISTKPRDISVGQGKTKINGKKLQFIRHQQISFI